MSANLSWSVDKSAVKRLTNICTPMNTHVITYPTISYRPISCLNFLYISFIQYLLLFNPLSQEQNWNGLLFTVWTGLRPNCPVHFPQVDVMTLSWLSWRRKPSPQRERRDWLLGKPGTQLVAWGAWSQHKWQIIDWVMDDEIRFTGLNKVRHFAATC